MIGGLRRIGVRLALFAGVSGAALAVTSTAFGAAVVPALTGSVTSSTTLAGVSSTAIGIFNPNYAYATDYYRGTLSVLNISNPAQPLIVGESASASSLTNATTVNVAGGYAYVVSKNRNGP